MKIKFCLIAVFLLTFSINLYSQIQIIPNKVKYKRVGKEVPDHKKTFDVTYPVVIGLENADTEENLLKTLNYWNNFEGNLEENLGNYHWLSELSYKVNYNKNFILDITLTMEGVGAYPDETSKNLVIDLKTGKQIFIKDVLTDLDKFAEKIGNAQKAELEQKIKEADKDEEDVEAYYQDVLEREGKFTVEKLDEFSVSDKGITIIYNCDFAHVAQALEPEGIYFFTWTKLKPFIKADGLLGKFIR